MVHWPRRTLSSMAHRLHERLDPRTVPPTSYIGLEHIGEGTLSLIGTGTSEHLSSPCFAVQQGDILFGQLRPYFRKVVRAPTDGVCTTEAWVLRPRGDGDPTFLFYMLANPSFIELCSRSAEGTRMPRARWDYVASVPLSWPPPDVQRRIVATLAPLDERIALNQRQAETLQAMLQALAQAHFHDAPSGGLPEDWRWGRLGELATPHRDTVNPSTLPSETPCVGLADLTSGSIALASWGRAADARSAKNKFTKGDLLFGRLRPGFKKVVVAPVDGICSPDILVLRPVTPAWGAWVLAWLTHDGFIDHACAVATGTRMPRAYWPALADHGVAVPPLKVANTHQEVAGPLIERLILGLAETRTLAQLRDLLLPGLMSGDIRPGG